MSFLPTKRAIPQPTEAPNRPAIAALLTAVNELSGVSGAPGQRAVRLGELLAAGVVRQEVDGAIAAVVQAAVSSGAYTDAEARAAVISATIGSGDTTHAPSAAAVYDALAAKAAGSLFSYGTYAPTLFNTLNVAAASAPVGWQYMRVGTMVMVGGQLNVTPTAGSSPVEVQATLPVASDPVAFGDAGGAGACRSGGVMIPISINADGGTNRLRFLFDPATAVGHTIFFSCIYIIR